MINNFTRDTIIESDFLFVSYNHANRELVEDAVGILVSEGIRIWYDSDLMIGENWLGTAKKMINHENCRGVIFFNSVESFKSDNVHKEREFAEQKQELCRNSDHPFFVFPVNVGARSTLQLFKRVFHDLPENDAEIERQFPIRYITTIANLFDSNVIYCYADPDDKNAYTQTLTANIKKALPSVVDKNILKKTMFSTGAGISIGSCRHTPVNNIPAYYLSRNQQIEYQGTHYIVFEGKAYTSKKINWRFLYAEDDFAVLISEDLVDVRNGGKDLNDWLVNSFGQTAFSEKELDEIREIRLLSENDIQKTDDNESFIFSINLDITENHFWISDISSGALQKVVKKNGAVYSQGYNFRTKKSGVRPVIVVSKDFLKKFCS